MKNSKELLLSLASFDEKSHKEAVRRSRILKEILTTGDMPFSMPVQFIDNPISKTKKRKKEELKKFRLE